MDGHKGNRVISGIGYYECRRHSEKGDKEIVADWFGNRWLDIYDCRCRSTLRIISASFCSGCCVCAIGMGNKRTDWYGRCTAYSRYGVVS